MESVTRFAGWARSQLPPELLFIEATEAGSWPATCTQSQLPPELLFIEATEAGSWPATCTQSQLPPELLFIEAVQPQRGRRGGVGSVAAPTGAALH